MHTPCFLHFRPCSLSQSRFILPTPPDAGTLAADNSEDFAHLPVPIPLITVSLPTGSFHLNCRKGSKYENALKIIIAHSCPLEIPRWQLRLDQDVLFDPQYFLKLHWMASLKMTLKSGYLASLEKRKCLAILEDTLAQR